MRKGISPVVSMALLVVVAVVGVIGFQLWNEAFQSGQTSLADQEAQNLPYTFAIDSIRGDYMYVYSNRNQSFNNVTIAGVACNVSTNLTIGLNVLNVSSCVQSNSINEIVYVLDENEFGARSIFPKESSTISVSVGGSAPINVTFWINITDPTASSETLQGIDIDGSGNIYVTGSCNGCGALGSWAMYTMKFNSTGGHQWTNITDPTVGSDTALDLVVDSFSNVYIGGVCDGCGALGDRAMYVMKFDTNGVHQWTNITDPTASGDYIYSIAVDSSNNVYVSGNCVGCGSTGVHAIYIMKFDTNGVHQWTNITDPTASSDLSYGIALDSSSNVYVAGSCTGCGGTGNQALYTMKFDTNGVHQWTNITDPSGGDDYPQGIALDSSSNAYVTGYCNTCGSLGGYALYTMKFDTNGVHQWTNITDPTASTDILEDIAVDSSNNAYVTGFCNGCGSVGGTAIYTMKFDTNGIHQWTNITDVTASSEIGNAITLDASDNPYIAGYCDGCGSVGGNAFYTFNLNGDTGVASND